MTDPDRPLKNPDRVPALSQIADPIGTAVGHGPCVQIVAATEPPPVQEISTVSIKHNRDSGNFEIAVDGTYENSNTGDRHQFRKGHVIDPEAAKVLKRTGPFPGDVDEQAEEATATAKANTAPENKAAPAPANKQV